MNIEERKAMIQDYTDKPWKRMNLATSLIAFSLDEGVKPALDKALTWKVYLEDMLAACRGTVDETPIRLLLTSLKGAIDELLTTQIIT